MKSFLIKFLFTLIFICILGNTGFSQSIYFCEGVDDDGYPISEASVFTIPDDGGYLYVLVRIPYEVACNSVTFEIDRNGSYDNTIYVDVEKNWVWFYKQINFYKSGSYKFFVYDCYDAMLVKGYVDIDFD